MKVRLVLVVAFCLVLVSTAVSAREPNKEGAGTLVDSGVVWGFS